MIGRERQHPIVSANFGIKKLHELA